MTRKRQPPDDRTGPLFPLPPPVPIEPALKQLKHPIWTENKAKLIERYLYYFVMITKHGTYIDGFAGPQEQGKPDMWSARLVLESEPRWLRNFYLFDRSKGQVDRLRQLVETQPTQPRGQPKRNVEVIHGDFNAKLASLLEGRPIKDNEATFCLIDQRTFECRWRTLEVVARYKPTGQHKIELFYFLPNHWLPRALAAQKDRTVPEEWWGRPDWDVLRPLDAHRRAALFARRFREELGYVSAKAWPIMQRQNGGAVMYFMIHATDHPEAPKLMSRAYRKAVEPREPPVSVPTI